MSEGRDPPRRDELAGWCCAGRRAAVIPPKGLDAEVIVEAEDAGASEVVLNEGGFGACEGGMLAAKSRFSTVLSAEEVGSVDGGASIGSTEELCSLMELAGGLSVLGVRVEGEREEEAR